MLPWCRFPKATALRCVFRKRKAAGMTVLALATTHTPQELHDADHIVDDLQAGETLIRQWLAAN